MSGVIFCRHLQEFNIGLNKFGIPDAVRILKYLQMISTLTKLCFCDNNLTDRIADNIASVITCNDHLQDGADTFSSLIAI